MIDKIESNTITISAPLCFLWHDKCLSWRVTKKKQIQERKHATETNFTRTDSTHVRREILQRIEQIQYEDLPASGKQYRNANLMTKFLSLE